MTRPGDKSNKPERRADRRPDVTGILSDVREVQRVLQQAVREALAMHKRRGLPIVAWEGGKVVWIPAEQIRLDE